MEANRWVGTAADHYILGETYSVSEMIDSSISNLQKAVALGYKDYSFLMGDVLLKNAKRDARWREIEAGVRKNKRIADAKIDQKLAAQLKTMAEKDQELRRTIPKLITLKGPKDPEVLEIRSKLRAMDSVNILIVSKVLDEKGWLGADVVSDTGASCILLVVQHMPLSMQEKYLPMMREAVKNGKAQTTDLALLEDGVLVRQAKSRFMERRSREHRRVKCAFSPSKTRQMWTNAAPPSGWLR